MLTVFLLAALLIGLGVLGMSVSILFKKDGKFPEYDVGSNEEMRKRGIRCYKDEDAALHKKRCPGNNSEACKNCLNYESGSNSRPS